MKMPRILFFAMVVFVGFVFAEPADAVLHIDTVPLVDSVQRASVTQPAAEPVDSVQTNPADYAFEHFYVSIEGGEIYPWGDLLDAVENTFYGGVGIRYSYWKNADGFMTFNYSYFKPVEKTKIDGIHQFSGKVGLDFYIKYIKPVVVGGGFACNFTRADVQDGVDISFDKDLGGTLADNETEFGWFFRLRLPVFSYKKFHVGINALWEQLWTLPERSDMLTVGAYIEREIW